VPEIKEEWDTLDIVSSNGLLGASVLAAAAGAWPETDDRKPWFSLFLPLYVAFMHLFLLRKVLCRNCYYYDKRCCTGWGKLAPLYGEKGDEADFTGGLALPAFFWITYPVIGAGGVIAAFRRDRDKSRLKHLGIFFLAFMAFNAWHLRRACLHCHHRGECPKGKSTQKMIQREVDL
jgi:hypothetical protein